MFNTFIEIKPEISEALNDFKNTEKKYYYKLKKDIKNRKMEEYLEKVQKFSESEPKVNILNYFLKNSTNKFNSSDTDNIKFYSKLMTDSFKEEMKFIEKKDFYEAKGNVKVVNHEGQTFVMVSIYWDKKNQKMYTKDTVFISDKEGNIFVAANGMIAKDDFSEYTFYNNSGEINPKEMPK